MRLHRGILVCCLAASALAGRPAHALEHVSVQLKWLHQFQFAGYYAAVEKGFYRDAGLDVELIEGAPDVDPAKVVLSGRAEFGVGTPEILLLRAEGEPIVVLGVIFQHSPYIFLGLSKSGISSVGDLVGRRVMIEPQAAELYAYLKREHVPLDQLTIKPHVFSADSLMAGDVDMMSAYSTDEPFTLHRAGIPYNTFTPRSGGVDFYGDCFFTTEAQVKEHRARTRAFYEATLRGWRYAFEHPEEIVDLIVAKYHSRKSRDALLFEAQKMRELIHPEIIPVGYMYDGRWRHIMETYEELGMLDSPIPLTGFLYEPNPRADVRWLYWTAGVAAACALIGFGILLPMWRLNRRLKIANEHAEEAVNAKGRFVAMVSHELRTPMNGVLGFAGLLRRTPLTPEQEEYVRTVETSTQSLLRLVDDLLDFSKIEAGRIEIEQRAFAVREMVAESVRFFGPAAKAKGIRLEPAVAADVPVALLGDCARIRQIVFNLLGNSLKFTERGSVSLAVQMSGSGPAPCVEFTVADTGAGMSEEELARAFEPFAQGDISVHRRFGGTGLGLSISRRLVELMGGSLEMSSRPGHGTTVRFRLPLAAAEIRDADSKSSVGDAGTTPAFACRILVADDDAVSARLMVALLKRAGHSVEVAQTGVQAVEKWRNERPDVLFMDMHMPEMGGIEAIRRIRAEEADSEHTFIIALTANADAGSQRDCLAAGADYYLAKPVSPDRIEQALTSRTGERAP